MRILLVSPLSPFGQGAGGQQRTAQLLDALRGLGVVDTLVIQQGQTWETVRDEALRQVTVTHPAGNEGLGAYSPDPQLSDYALRQLPVPIDEYSIVLGRYLRPVCLLDVPRTVPVIVDLDDFDYRFNRHSLRHPAVWKEWLKRRIGHLLARRQLQRFAGGFFVSERDQSHCRGMRSSLLPNVPSLARVLPRQPDGKTILFVGSMWYRPNREAVEWFIAQVLPLIRAANPAACFRIVGAAPEAQRDAWASHAGVSAPGFVDDLAAAYASAAVVVAPIHSGGGTNIKILEALGHACPTVITPFSHEALASRLHDGQHLLVADSATQFANACLRLLRGDADAARLGETGQAAIAHHFSASGFNDEVMRFVGEFVVTSGQTAPATA